jgi:hypothetical protein
VTAATQVICAVVFPGRTTVTGYRERALGRFVIRLCVTAAGGLIRTRFNSSVSRFDLIGVMHGRPPGHYASFRRNIAHVGRRQDRKVRANSGTRFEPEKFLRKQTPDLRQRCARTVAQRSHRTLVSDSFVAGFKK